MHAPKHHELVTWVSAHGRLPRFTKGPDRTEERLLAHRLHNLKKRYQDGTARLHHLELLLSIPGCLNDQDRSHAETRAAELRRLHEAKLLEQQSKVSFDDARWEASFTELQTWVARTGALPRRRTDDPQEYKVANWLNIQRTHCRHSTLSLRREEKLRTVPGALTARANRPVLERVAEVGIFLSRHGRLPSSSATDPTEASLGDFVAATRYRLRSGYFSAELAATVAAEATKIPGFLPSDGGHFYKTAAQNLQALKSYVARHGHLPWGSDSRSLLVWLHKAGSGAVGGEESEIYLAAVREIRASTPDHSSWRMVTRFEEYLATHGHLPPESGKEGERFSVVTLHRLLDVQSTPEPFKDRIRRILASTPAAATLPRN